MTESQKIATRCRQCDGRGWYDGECPDCNGSGKVLGGSSLPSDPAGLARPVTQGELATLIRGYREMGGARSIEDDNTFAALLELNERRSLRQGGDRGQGSRDE